MVCVLSDSRTTCQRRRIRRGNSLTNRVTVGIWCGGRDFDGCFSPAGPNKTEGRERARIEVIPMSKSCMYVPVSPMSTACPLGDAQVTRKEEKHEN